MVHRHTLPSPSVPCLFAGEYTEERLPIPIAPSLLSLYTNHRDYSGRIFVAIAKGHIEIIIYVNFGF